MLKKKIILFCLLSLLGLTGCNSNENPTNEKLPIDSSLKVRHFEVKNFEGLMQGEIINLSDYVEVVPSIYETNNSGSDLDFDYEILSPEDEEPLVESYTPSNSLPSLKKSKYLALNRPGQAVIKLTSEGSYKVMTFNIAANPSYETLVNYFENNSFTNYTIAKGFELSASGEAVSIKPNNTFYKGENFMFDATLHQGLSANKDGNIYYFFANSLDSEFKFLPYGKDEDKIEKKNRFNASYPSLSLLFNSKSLTYNPLIERLYGEDYKFVLGYSTQNSKLFDSALRNLGLTRTRSMNNETVFTYFIVPVLKNDSISFYTISMGATSYKRYFEGPYKLIDVGTTSNKKLDEFYNSKGYTYLTNSELVNFTSINSFTASGKALLKDMNGNEVKEIPDIFQNEITLGETLTKATNNAFESNQAQYIDDSLGLSHVIFKNNDNHISYYDASKTTPILKGTYGKGNDWKEESNIGVYSTIFDSTTLFTSANYLKLDEDKYRVATYKDDFGYYPIEYLMGGLNGARNITNDSLFYYYSVYSYLDLNISSNWKDDGFSGEIHEYVIADEIYYEYVFSFEIKDINNTMINI